jgi:WD40 repeat protein
VVLSVGVAAITTHLWRRSADLTRRVEALRLLDLARDRLEEMPPVALAHAVASLGLVDDIEARDVALEALLSSPMPRIVEQARVPDNPVTSVDFSSDGLNLALGHWRGAVQIWDRHGGLITEWSALDGMPEGQGQVAAWFTPDSRVVATTGVFDRWFRFWDVSSNELLENQEKTGWRPPVGLSQHLAGTTTGLVGFVHDRRSDHAAWSVDRRPILRLRDLVGEHIVPAAVDREADLLVFAENRDLYAARLSHLPSGDPWLVARSPRRIEHVALCPGGRSVAAVDVSAAVSIWSLGDGLSEPVWSWPGADLPMRWALRFGPSGRLLAAGTYGSGTLVWDLDGPPDADPLWLSWPGGQVAGLGFHPTESWLATCNVYGATVWRIERDRHPYLLRGHSQPVQAVAFGPDGRSLVSAADDGTVRFWPLDRSGGAHGRIIHDWGAPIEGQWLRLGVLPDARSVAVAGGPDGVWLIPLHDGGAVRLEGAEGQLTALAVDTERRRVAASGVNFAPEHIFVWDLDRGTSSVFALGRDRRIHDLAFHGDQTLLASADDGRLLRVDLETGATTALSENVVEFDLAANAHTLLAWGDQPDQVRMIDVRTGAEQILDGRPDPGPAVALDADGLLAVSSGPRRTIQVGSTAGEIPRLLIGHRGRATSLAVSRDGRWIASASSADSVIRLWSKPDVDAIRLHALSRRALLQRLRATTNLVVEPVEQDPGRYRLEVVGFSGWVTPPPL